MEKEKTIGVSMRLPKSIHDMAVKVSRESDRTLSSYIRVLIAADLKRINKEKIMEVNGQTV